MPVESTSEARDAIYRHVVAAWLAQEPPIPELRYEDVPAETPADNVSWARLIVRHTTEPQVALGSPGQRRFRAFGTVIVEIRAPVNDGLKTVDRVGDVALRALQGARTGLDHVTFMNVRKNEIGPEGPWYRMNVLADFDYDTVR